MGYIRGMDSEKNTHMRELLEAGRPVTDEGPFYHHAWWESYKGGVKGKLGGGFLGAGIGSVTGLAAAGITAVVAANLAVPVAIGATTVGLITAGFAAAGMMYGVHEFSEVGRVAGAVAATEKTAEKRMKAYEDSKFAEIKEEISELKALVKGEPLPEKTAEAAAAVLKEHQDDYRTNHFQGSMVEGIERFVFWKVALVGLIIGVAAGAILASGGGATHILEGLGTAEGGLGMVGNYIASMTAMGAIGASFGINRDIFRQIFDQTDLWFRGFVSHDHAKSVLLDPSSKTKDIEIPKETVMYEHSIPYPESTTYHRDKVMNAAREALLKMDHTKMSPN